MVYKEASEEKRREYQKKLEKIPPAKRIYLDESGVDQRSRRLHARTPRGQKVIEKVPAQRGKRTSILAALQGKKLLAPYHFEGSCNTPIFNAWLKEHLLPLLPEGSVLILDNARFHHSKETKSLVKKAKCKLLFLPPYSPDFNPIEHCWHQLKSLIRSFFPFLLPLHLALPLAFYFMSYQS